MLVNMSVTNICASTVTHLLHINVPWRTLNNWCKKLGPFTARVEHVHVFPIVIWSQWRHEYTKDYRIAAGRLTSSFFFYFLKVFLLNRPHSFGNFRGTNDQKTDAPPNSLSRNSRLEYLNPFPLSNLTNLGLHENFSSQSLNLTNFKFRNTNKLPKHPPRTPRKIFIWLNEWSPVAHVTHVII